MEVQKEKNIARNEEHGVLSWDGSLQQSVNIQ